MNEKLYNYVVVEEEEVVDDTDESIDTEVKNITGPYTYEEASGICSKNNSNYRNNNMFIKKLNKGLKG